MIIVLVIAAVVVLLLIIEEVVPYLRGQVVLVEDREMSHGENVRLFAQLVLVLIYRVTDCGVGVGELALSLSCVHNTVRDTSTLFIATSSCEINSSSVHHRFRVCMRLFACVGSLNCLSHCNISYNLPVITVYFLCPVPRCSKGLLCVGVSRSVF